MWRTGANEATEITLTRDMTIGEKEIKAGTYSIFTIPDDKEWVIILNSDLGQWGSYNYNNKTDVERWTVPVSILPSVKEKFTISVETRNNLADLIFAWDNVKVSLPVVFHEPKP